MRRVILKTFINFMISGVLLNYPYALEAGLTIKYHPRFYYHTKLRKSEIRYPIFSKIKYSFRRNWDLSSLI